MPRARLARELDDVLVAQRVDELADLLAVVELLAASCAARRRRPRRSRSSSSRDLPPSSRAAQPRWVSRIWPTFMRRRHAERIQHDVDRRAVGEVRHVLLGQDAREHALVAVAAGHLVADLELALDGDEDLDHLDDARRQLVAALQALDLLVEGAS